MRDGSFYRAHLEDDVLAWWLRHGPDRDHGGVLTCFANTGDNLVSTDKYTWSQGRWVWLLARLWQAQRRGLVSVGGDEVLEQAVATAEFIAAHALLDGGRTAYVTTREGVAKPYGAGGDPHASVFADLFVVLGFAGLQRTLDQAGVPATRSWGALAEALLVSADERLRAGTAMSEPYPVDARFRSFAGPMMLMHAAAELHEATGSPTCRDVATRAALTALGAEFVVGSDVHDLAPVRPDVRGSLLARHRTPGHLLEFLWFLAHAQESVPGLVDDAQPDPSWVTDAALRALELGWDDRGGLLRYVDVDGGRPRGDLLGDRYEDLVVRTWDTKLWWPHAEALYTTALLATRYGDDRLAGWHDRVRDYTFSTFPEGDGREWTQIRTRDGAPLDEVVALPVKDPFHIARALLLLTELAEEDES